MLSEAGGSGKKTCPACGAENAGDAAFCGNCRYRFEREQEKFSCKECGFPIRDYPCPKCGFDPGGKKKTKKGKASDFASKYPWVVALAQAGIMLAALVSFFGSVLSFLMSPLIEWFPRLEFVPYLAVFALLFVGAYAWTKRFGLTWGIVCCVIVVLLIGIAIPLATEGFPWLLSGGEGSELFSKTFGVADWSCVSKNILNPMNLQQCWTPYESAGEAPSYTGSKTYELLKIYLGNERPPMSGEYEVPTAYAYPESASQSEVEEYELPFYVENLAEESSGNGGSEGITLENVHVDHVYAYKNPKDTGDEPLLEFQSIDVCSATYPCNLKPGEQKKKIYATGFDEVWNGTDYLDVQNRVPCEIEDLKKMQFEVEVAYNQIATHERTLIVARSSEDEQVIYEDSNLKNSLGIKAPSDGPLDVLIDFNENPYAIGDRPVDQVRMSVWVSNEEVSGLYKPSSLVVYATGGFPDWLSAEGTQCSLMGDAIIFDISASGFTSKTKEYKCTLKISDYPAANAYQKVVFSGVLSYTYKSVPDFSSSEYLAKVDRSSCS